jgi:hypothetical protein
VFSPSQIARYRTGSEYVVRQITEPNVEIKDKVDVQKLTAVYNYSNDDIIRIFKDKVIPILMSNVLDIEKQFNEELPDFSKKIEELNKITFEKIEEPKKIADFIFESYDLLEQIIKTGNAADKFREKILGTLQVLRDFDSVFLGILQNRPEQLSDALDEIRKDEDFQDFETSRNGLLLAFFCTLVYIKEELKDKQKLTKILEISEKYSSNLQGWTDTIDIMSNPEEVKHVKQAEEYYKTR